MKMHNTFGLSLERVYQLFDAKFKGFPANFVDIKLVCHHTRFYEAPPHSVGCWNIV